MMKKKSQTKKIDRLFEQQIITETINCKHVFHPRLINKTDILFSDEEISLLNKGLNFNFPNDKKNSLIAELFNAETAVKQLKSHDARDSTRVVISNKLNQTLNNPIPRTKYLSKYRSLKQVAASIRNKLQQNDAVITKADKGNCTVILSQQNYVNKVHDFLENNNIDILTQDPTTSFSKDINKLISSSTNLLSSDEIKHVKATNPQAPVLRGLPKIHKPNVPIRPLVNFRSSPAYKISQKTRKNNQERNSSWKWL